MINNDFRLIGTVLTDFESIGDEKFAKAKFLLEVDKKKGGYTTFPVIVYGTNREIDVSKSLKGKRVVLVGYLDCFKEYLSLVAQDLVVVGGELHNVNKNSEEILKTNNYEENDNDLPF